VKRFLQGWVTGALKAPSHKIKRKQHEAPRQLRKYNVDLIIVVGVASGLWAGHQRLW